MSLNRHLDILFHKIFEISTLKSHMAIEFCETAINHKVIANVFFVVVDVVVEIVVVEFDSWQIYAPYSHIYDNILLIANFYFMFDGQTERKEKTSNNITNDFVPSPPTPVECVCVHCIIRFTLALLLLRVAVSVLMLLLLLSIWLNRKIHECACERTHAHTHTSRLFPALIARCIQSVYVCILYAFSICSETFSFIIVIVVFRWYYSVSIQICS